MSLALAGTGPVVFNVCQVDAKKKSGDLPADTKLGPVLGRAMQISNVAGSDANARLWRSAYWLVISGRNGLYINVPPAVIPNNPVSLARGFVQELTLKDSIAWMELVQFAALSNYLTSQGTNQPLTSVAAQSSAQINTELARPAIAGLCTDSGPGGGVGPNPFQKVWTPTDVIVTVGLIASFTYAAGFTLYTNVPAFKALIDKITAQATALGAKGADFLASKAPEIKNAYDALQKQLADTGKTPPGDKKPPAGTVKEVSLQLLLRNGTSLPTTATLLDDGTYTYSMTVPLFGQVKVNFDPKQCVIKPAGTFSFLGNLLNLPGHYEKETSACWFSIPGGNYEFGIKVQAPPDSTLSTFTPYFLIGGGLLAFLLLFKGRR